METVAKKSPGPKGKLKDPEYRKRLIELWPNHTAKEVADIVGANYRTVEAHMAKIRNGEA